jgi:hypothetical protein
MSGLRFEVARDVFEAFPTAYDDIEARPTEAPPLAFLRSLASGPTPDDAIGFCAYLLPRREAVWWASQCVRDLIGTPTESDEIALGAAEDWVREPEEPKRRAALRIGLAADRRAASTWVALAAAWSGGSLIESEYRGPAAPPHLTAKAARGALMLALVDKPHRGTQISQCVKRGVQIAESL